MDDSKRFTECLRERIQLPAAQKFYRSQRLEMVMMNKAHGLMLVECGLLAKEAYEKIAAGLDRVYETMTEADIDGDKEDFYFNFYYALCKEIGEDTACLIHTGRSRNDICCTTNRMEIRRSIHQACQALLTLQKTLLEKARLYADTPVTYYTYGQPAQPGMFGHYCLTQFEAFCRDFSRLQAAYGNVNRCPMGAAAGIGTSYPLDRRLVCELLGFDGVIENTLDAISSFDYIVQTQSALALFMGNVSRMAADLFFWASDECAVLDCDMAICAGSSIMPQKKNPAAVEYTRARSCHSAGTLMEMFLLYQKASSFPNIDNNELFYNYWESLDTVLAAAGELTEVLEHAHIRRGRALAHMRRSLVGAASFAERLAVRLQLPFTQTHDIVAAMVRRLLEEERVDSANMTGELLREASLSVIGRQIDLPDEEIARLLDPQTCLDGIVTAGSPKPDETRSLAEAGWEKLRYEEDWLRACRAQVDAAYRRIREA